MPCDPTTTFLWNTDPVFFHVGSTAVRYYSVCFVLVCVVGYFPWQKRMMRGGHSAHVASRLVPFAVFGIVAGGRLAHCLFYEPDYYLAHPLQILDVSRGGLASHGSATGLFVMFFLYSRMYELTLAEICDRFSISAILGASFVRIGNFFNSEIVGSEWCGPLAVRYARFAAHNQRLYEKTNEALGWVAQPLPRHPVQLYEWAGMVAIAGILWWVDRRNGERAPRGQQVGLMFVLYFSFRFALEGVKEFQRFTTLVPDAANRVIHVMPTAEVTMGQWLSLPFVAIGIALLVRTRRTTN